MTLSDISMKGIKKAIIGLDNSPIGGKELMNSDNRVKTGIPAYKEGLESMDELMEGGIPRNNIVLVTGPAGSGKSILSLQLLVNGAQKFGEKGMYISFEQNKDDIIRGASAFNWDIKKLEEEEKLKVLSLRVVSKHAASINKEIMNQIESFKPERLVFDSISSYIVSMEAIGYTDILMDYNLEGKSNVQISPEMAMRRSVMQLIETIKSAGTTAFLISERSEGSEFLSRDTVSEFLVDGVLVLNFIGVATEEFGTIQVRKMRHTKHARTTYQTFITDEGMKIGEAGVGTLR